MKRVRERVDTPLVLMGYANPFDVIVALSALELTLAELGYPLKLGEGIRATQEALQWQPEG